MVVCPDCGYESREDARFCGGCGIRREKPPDVAVRETGPPRVGPFSGLQLPQPPRHLAEKILSARQLLGERKHVTVLFADVKGSMDLAAQVDPEEWLRIIDRFFAILAEGIYRFEGSINQYAGDGIMALFGAPIAHEDHAQRACYAALSLVDALRRYAQELRRERGLDFSVRMGINSGEVVVGTIGDDLRMDYTAQGHTVGLAARMEQLAEAGRVYLTEHTAAAVAGYFRTEDLGPFTIKGVATPVRVFALLGAGPLRSRFDIARARGLSRFVGRSEEMERLERALGRALEGAGQVVGIVGEAGVGKSRLCFELLERARGRGVTVSETYCVAHGKMVSFLPLLRLLRGYFGITEQDSDGEAQRKIAGTVLLLDAELTESLALIFDFLGVGDGRQPIPQLDPVARQEQLFQLLRRLLHARSAREPTVILWEDLHWIDSGSQAFLETFAQGLGGTGLLLLVNFRPEYHPAWLESAGGEQLPLVPLSAGAIDELLTDLLGDSPSLAVLAGRIREHTGGNPFFIEEVVRSLVDHGVLVPAPDGSPPQGESPPGTAGLSGRRARYVLAQPVTDIEIPPTVQAVLAARIDRLGEREKEVLHTAAVIGKRFWEPVLRRVFPISESDLAEALLALTAAEFIYTDAVYPEAEYAFQHPLTREVAYHTQLSERRARVHAAVGRAIEELYPDRLDERAAVLAYHWEGAGNALEAARWHRRAAEWIRLSNLPEALRHWQHVHRLLRPQAPSAERDRLALEACIRLLEIGWRLGIADSDAARVVSEGEHLAHTIEDVAGLARLISAYASVKSHRGNADAWVSHCRRAVQLADQTENAGLQLATRNRLTLSLGFAGRLVEARDLAERSLVRSPTDVKLGVEILGYSPYIRLLEQHARCLIDLGRLGEGAEKLAIAARLAHEHGELEILGWVHGQYVSLARIRGDAETAVTHAREGMRIAEKLGSPFFRAGASLSFGQAHILSGQWRDALAALESALAIAQVGQASVDTEPLALAWMAAAYLGLRNAANARTAAETGLVVAQQRGTRVAECIAHIGRARVMIRVDGVRARASIEAELTRAMELVEQTGAASNEPFIRVQLARLAGLNGDTTTWQRELRRAREHFLAMGAPARASRLPVTGL